MFVGEVGGWGREEGNYVLEWIELLISPTFPLRVRSRVCVYQSGVFFRKNFSLVLSLYFPRFLLKKKDGGDDRDRFYAT